MSDHNKNITTILKPAESEETRDAKAFVDPRLPETSISDVKIAEEFAKASLARAENKLKSTVSSAERVKSVAVSEVFPGL